VATPACVALGPAKRSADILQRFQGKCAWWDTLQLSAARRSNDGPAAQLPAWRTRHAGSCGQQQAAVVAVAARRPVSSWEQ
jgi:hypothetical protein